MSKNRHHNNFEPRVVVTEEVVESPVEEPQDSGSDAVMGDDSRKHIELDYNGFIFDFVPARLRDQRILYIIGKLQNTTDTTKLMQLQTRFFDIVLGDDALDVMDALAEQSEGVLDEQAFAEFVSFLFEAAEVKN